MSAITVFQRYEKKYLMEEETMERLLPEIRRHMEPDAYCREGGTYPISNLYFDTEGFDVIRESLSKPFYKEKLRLRSYGIPENPDDRVFLEMKKKVNRMVNKRRAKLCLSEAEAFLKNRTMPDNPSYMTAQVLREIAYYLSHKEVKPAMRISYDRLAFFDREDRQFRLTFDQNLRCLRELKGMADPREGSLFMPNRFRLMEVKVSQNMPLWFSRLLAKEGIGISSFSKYGVAYKTYLKEEVLEEEQIWVLGPI